MNHTEQCWALGMDAVYLAGRALRGDAPIRVESDSAALLKFCQFHSISAIVAMAMELPADPELRGRWVQSRDQSIRKSLLFNAERQAILTQLEALGCRYMPLKGSLLQFDYPKFGMRQMTDNDILVDPALRQQIHDLFLARGYTAVAYLQSTKEDIYQKPPVYNFEMHMELFSELDSKDMTRYFRNIWENAVKLPEGRFGYRQNDDHFYIYMLAHAYKHFTGGGIGIRNLLDIQVFLEKRGKNLDLGRVERELRKLGVYEFEQLCRSLCEKLFAGDPRQARLTELERRSLLCFFTSGTFGTEENAFRNRFHRLQKKEGRITLWTKVRFVLRRLFPPMEALRRDYPDLDNAKWKIPFIILRRLLRCLFHPVKTFRELSRIHQVKE